MSGLSEDEILAGAKATLTLMTARRMAVGMLPVPAFESALASFVVMCGGIEAIAEGAKEATP